MNKSMMAAAAFLSVAGSLAACSSSSGIAAPGAGEVPREGGANTSVGSGDLPCDVSTVLAHDCQSCHGSPTTYGAPMSLVTYGDLIAPAKTDPTKKVYELVEARIHDDKAPMPQAPNARLDASSTATIDAWVAAGAPAAATGCGGDPGTASVVQPLSCTPNQIIRPTSAFAVTSDPDLYVCYGFDTPAAAKMQVIAGAPHIDNKSVVHHVLLYQAPDTVSGTPAPCGSGGGKDWRLVTGWAPGGKNFELPPEAGFAEEAGTTHWAVQIHYNNAQGLQNQMDATGYDLCATEELRANDADILATGTVQISIPPKSTWQADCDFTVPKGFGDINLISSWAHMHRLGRAQSATLTHAGVTSTVLDAPTYDFSTGASAQTIDVLTHEGDNIHTTCKWTNASDATVAFGEATEDEMCFAFLTYYPKITAAQFNWKLPAAPVVSKCAFKSVNP